MWHFLRYLNIKIKLENNKKIQTIIKGNGAYSFEQRSRIQCEFQCFQISNRVFSSAQMQCKSHSVTSIFTTTHGNYCQKNIKKLIVLNFLY